MQWIALLALLLLVEVCAAGDIDADRLRIAPRDGDAFTTCAYPMVDRLADGRLLCVYSTWRDNDRSHTKVVGVFSDDHGRSWGDPVTLIDSHPHLDYDPAIIVMDDVTRPD